MPVDEPEKPEQNRDRTARGLFAAGNKIGLLGGRPRGLSFQTLLAEVAAETKETSEEVGRESIRRLRALGAGSDAVALQALKLLIERAFEKDADKLDVNYSGLPPEQLRARLRALIEDAFGDE